MNGNAWMLGLQKLLGISIEQLKKSENGLYKKAYNTLQRSDAPEWQKIAVGFLSNNTLYLLNFVIC